MRISIESESSIDPLYVRTLIRVRFTIWRRMTRGTSSRWSLTASKTSGSDQWGFIYTNKEDKRDNQNMNEEELKYEEC